MGIKSIINTMSLVKKNPKSFFIIILIIVAVMLLLIKSDSDEKKSFEIVDKCGRFMNLMSHTINSEGECKIRCISQCEAKDYKFDKVEFKIGEESCNYCMCYCRA